MAVRKHHDHQHLGEEKAYLVYTSICTGTQAGQEPGGGADAEAMEEYYLLACSPWFAQPAF